MNKLTDGHLIQFASNPPWYQGLCLYNNADWRWGRVPSTESLMGRSLGPLPHPAVSLYGNQMGILVLKLLSLGMILNSFSDP